MHIKNQIIGCPELNTMKTSTKEKYLGDILTNDGKNDKKITIG